MPRLWSALERAWNNRVTQDAEGNGPHLRYHASKAPTSTWSFVRWKLHYLRMFLLPLSIRLLEFSATASTMGSPTSTSTLPQEGLDHSPGHCRQCSQAYSTSCARAIRGAWEFEKRRPGVHQPQPTSTGFEGPRIGICGHTNSLWVSARKPTRISILTQEQCSA